jgi:hypothetical protein
MLVKIDNTLLRLSREQSIRSKSIHLYKEYIIFKSFNHLSY